MLQWIKTQVLEFFGSVQSPYYKKLKRVLDSQKLISKYNKIYYLGGFEYSDSIHTQFKEYLDTGKLKEFLENAKYNAQGDNIEIYLIENNETNFLLALLDPLELFGGEQILDIIKSPRIKLEEVKHELVYPNAA